MMAKPQVVLSPVVRGRAAQLGAAGAVWLSGLPELIADLEQRWSVTIGQQLHGGTASYVARARTADGRDAVVKLAVPAPAFARQIRTLAAARGCGYVRLLAHDEENYAVLLEALGPPLNHLGLSAEVQIDTLCDMLPAAWRVPPPTSPNAVVAVDKARGLAELVAQLWQDLGRPCSERVTEYALQCAERRAAAFDPDRCVIVHGDAAPYNAVQVLAPRAGAESGFVFVDPDGFLGDPTYDLGVVLRDWCPELLAGDAPSVARGYCRQIAARTGLEEAAIWQWGFLERVSTGLHLLSLTPEDPTPSRACSALVGLLGARQTLIVARRGARSGCRGWGTGNPRRPSGVRARWCQQASSAAACAAGRRPPGTGPPGPPSRGKAP